MSEPTSSLGEFLRQEREKRGITIEQVASATKIGIRTLHALESDQYNELPAKPFVRGFVTSYARFVGVDPQELLVRFDEFLELKSSERPNRDAGHSGYAFEKPEGEQSRTFLWIVMIAFLVIGGVLLMVLKPHLKHSKHGHLDQLRPNPLASSIGEDGMPMPALIGPVVSPTPHSSVSVSPTPWPVTLPTWVAPGVHLASPVPSPVLKVLPQPTPTLKVLSQTQSILKALPQPIATPQKSIEAKPSPVASDKVDVLNQGKYLKPEEIKFKVVVRALEDVWVRFRLDDRPISRFILLKDKLLVLRATQTVRFQAGAPESVEFSQNGKIYSSLSAAKNATTVQGEKILVLPQQAIESISEVFPGDSPVPKTRGPKPRVESSSMAPAQ